MKLGKFVGLALMADIHWNGSFSRQDIGYRAIAREQGE